MKKSFDVVVVGAGPAGAGAALRLASKGFDTLIIEKEALPRVKPCAGMLPPRIAEVMTVPRTLIEREIVGFRLFDPLGGSLKVNFPEGRGVTVDRKIFDGWLVKKAVERGCNLLEKTRVTDVKQHNGKVEVRADGEDIHANFVISADGVLSTTRRSLGLPEPPRDKLAFAYQMVFKQDSRVIEKTTDSYFEVHYDASLFPQGYLWVAPYRSKFSVGFGALLTAAQAKPKETISRVTQAGRLKSLMHGSLLEREEAHLIPYSGPWETLGKGRVLFVGDAGGFVNPFTGEGIYFAIQSGYVAADTVSAYDSNVDLVKLYEEKLAKAGLLRLRDFVEERRLRLKDNNSVHRYIRGLTILAGNNEN